MLLKFKICVSHCRVSLAALLLIVGCGCASLPDNPVRAPSQSLRDTGHSRLGKAVGQQMAAHAGKNGVHLLPSGRDAFALRMLLVEAAQRSLDLQYYIWKDDIVGQLLIQKIWEAAERG